MLAGGAVAGPAAHAGEPAPTPKIIGGTPADQAYPFGVGDVCGETPDIYTSVGYHHRWIAGVIG
ncbi:hypothetical protein ACIBI3_07440 [Actinomadura luteofluorescens]|uniref:hypothetical protein n=1 Tax=Actinomadura luteofluorescens TaxID=46163 RepID=UPI00349783AF